MASPSSGSSFDPNLEIIVERNPSQSRLSELGVHSWPKWACAPGTKMKLKYHARQTCYLVKGKVKAYPNGSSEAVEFGAGDLVFIPEGLTCTWNVSVAVDEFYMFDPS